MSTSPDSKALTSAFGVGAVVDDLDTIEWVSPPHHLPFSRRLNTARSADVDGDEFEGAGSDGIGGEIAPALSKLR